MSKPFTPKIVTANALLEGDVIYLTDADQWSREMSDAGVITDADQVEARLKIGNATPNDVVGVYLAEVEITRNGPKPSHFRETFRARGPSNYVHGKQELS